ncbi:hypothetical protein EDB81DRAFT_60339 [Dactylonectria macrodidyma]|uniref:Uncharacterized protein n=1 Tax=Dactylonectria macrodidyma TaxID=307937 RepID=A0A9P9ENY9_9HYPO|nr:hypothetical protein EDB81DRAFT_60339 [Dactylonectria macrodidyma]
MEPRSATLLLSPWPISSWSFWPVRPEVSRVFESRRSTPYLTWCRRVSPPQFPKAFPLSALSSSHVHSCSLCPILLALGPILLAPSLGCLVSLLALALSPNFVLYLPPADGLGPRILGQLGHALAAGLAFCAPATRSAKIALHHPPAPLPHSLSLSIASHPSAIILFARQLGQWPSCPRNA